MAVLNHLAAHPGERFTLSEIARRLELNKATLHAILAALAAGGYIVRDDARKTYGLGPALIALGNSALQASPAAQVAVPEMQSLTDDLGLDVVASADIGDEIVILARTGTPRPFGVNVFPGQRLPLQPPLGTVFVAWAGAQRIERWLARVPSPDAVPRHRESLEIVRARGYSVGIEAGVVPSGRRDGGRKPSLEERVRGIRIEEYALDALEPRGAYRLNHIGAPVFGPDGAVAVALFLIGFAGEIAGEDVPRLADRVCDAAERVTQAIGGRAPAA